MAGRRVGYDWRVTAPPARPLPTRTEIGLSGSGAAKELVGILQPVRLLLRLPWLVPRRSGPGRAVRVVVVPGRNQADATTLPLRAYLAAQGFRAGGWGLGRHVGLARDNVPRLVERLEADQRGDPGPVALVGQSLGGYVAREVARLRPDLVSQVITLGTPLFGPLAPLPLERPVLALWSRRDQVVPPLRAIDPEPSVDHLEVGSTHFAMGLDPDVWRAVADRLAAGGS
jgi:pimeloyl-ACP methyl ester carboxylesterase